MWVPISSTNISRLGSKVPASARQSTLSHSSLLLAAVDLFSALAQALDRPANVAYLDPVNHREAFASLPVGGPRWASTSSFSSRMAYSSSFGREPGHFYGARTEQENHSHRAA